MQDKTFQEYPEADLGLLQHPSAFILDIAAVLDPPLISGWKKCFFLKYSLFGTVKIETFTIVQTILSVIKRSNSFLFDKSFNQRNI